MNDDKPATKEEARLALEAAYEAGRQAGATEQRPELRVFSNGVEIQPSADPTFVAYEKDLKVAVAEARAEGVLNVQTDARILAVKAKHGR
jgi:hypothetical protein